MTLRRHMPALIAAFLALAAASDVLGGLWTTTFHGVLTLIVIAGIGAVALLAFAFLLGLLGRVGRSGR